MASLLHDDVIDSATTRRGLKALNTVFGNKARPRGRGLAPGARPGRAPTPPRALRRAAAVHHLVVSPSPLRAGQVAILAGDFLLARASVTLASLRNPEVIMLISQVRAGAGARALSPGG